MADIGYSVQRIEQPVATEAGRVVADLILVAAERSAILVVESKERTVQEPQAERYGKMTPLDVIQTGGVNVQAPDKAVLDVAYAVRAPHASAVVASLSRHAGRIAVLSIGTAITWDGPSPADVELRRVMSTPVPADPRAIPRLLVVDDGSPPEMLANPLANQLQAAMESGRESISVAALVEAACWGWPRYGRAFQGKLARTVTEMLRTAAKNELADIIVVEKATGQSAGLVRFVAVASEATTQAGELRAARATRAKLDAFVARVHGRPSPAVPDQMELDLTSDEVLDDEGDEQW